MSESVSFDQALHQASELMERDQLEEAMQWTSQALALRPANQLAQNLLGLLSFHLGHFRKALKLFEGLVQRNPDVITLHVNAGLAAYRLHHQERAMEHFRHAVELDPSYSRGFGYLSLVHLMREEFPFARAALQESGLEQLAARLTDEMDGESAVRLAQEIEQKIEGLLLCSKGDSAPPAPHEGFAEIARLSRPDPARSTKPDASFEHTQEDSHADTAPRPEGQLTDPQTLLSADIPKVIIEPQALEDDRPLEEIPKVIVDKHVLADDLDPGILPLLTIEEKIHDQEPAAAAAASGKKAPEEHDQQQDQGEQGDNQDPDESVKQDGQDQQAAVHHQSSWSELEEHAALEVLEDHDEGYPVKLGEPDLQTAAENQTPRSDQDQQGEPAELGEHKMPATLVEHGVEEVEHEVEELEQTLTIEAEPLENSDTDEAETTRALFEDAPEEGHPASQGGHKELSHQEDHELQELTQAVEAEVVEISQRAAQEAPLEQPTALSCSASSEVDNTNVSSAASSLETTVHDEEQPPGNSVGRAKRTRRLKATRPLPRIRFFGQHLLSDFTIPRAAGQQLVELHHNMIVLRLTPATRPFENAQVIVRQDHLILQHGELTMAVAQRIAKGCYQQPFVIDQSPMMTLSGSGHAVLHPPPGHRYALLSLENDSIYVRESCLVAYSRWLHWENGRLPGLGPDGPPMIHFSGDGFLAIHYAGTIYSDAVQEKEQCAVCLDYLLGWSGNVVPLLPVRSPATISIGFQGAGLVVLNVASPGGE